MENKMKTAPREQGADCRKGSRNACLIQVIAVETAVGSGTERNPNRIVTEYWSPEGELLAVRDPEFNPLGETVSKADSPVFNGAVIFYADGQEVCGERFRSFDELKKLLDRCTSDCVIEVKVKR